jgi:hypothetical protein
MSCICEFKDDIVKIVSEEESKLQHHAFKYKDADTIAEWNRVRNLLNQIKNSSCCRQKEDG